MLAQVAMPLAIPIDNPFPLTLTLGSIGMVAFAVELALARRRLRQRVRLSVLLAGCLLVAAMLALWAAYYAVNGPADAEPIVHLTGAHDSCFDFYRTTWFVNIVFALALATLALVVGASERRSLRALKSPQP